MRRIYSGALCLLLLIPCISLADVDSFPRPPELEPAVGFWTRIYAEVTTDGGLLHDRDDLEIVYERLDFTGMTPTQRTAHVRDRREHYQNTLRRLASSPQGPLSKTEHAIMDAWPEGTTRERLQRAAGNVRFQLGQADRFQRGLVRSGAWERHIRQTLAEMGLPPEIAALPHVESSFNPEAYSRAGAAGIWQFTQSTGRRFMRVDHVVDERMDPFTATVAAARLLEHNHSVTGDWALALSAYNHGLAGIRRAAQSVGSTNIAEIIHEYNGPRWGFASRNFYPAFLAAVDVDTSYETHFGPIQRHAPLATEAVELPFYTSIDAVATAFEVDPETLRDLNRALRPPVWNGQKHIPRGYRLRVPADPDRPSAETLLAQIDPGDQFYAQIPDEFHRVRQGEALSVIARRYGTTTAELVRLNNLRSAHHIRAGQNLRLPVSGQQAPAIAEGVYTVRRGDTLSGIANRTGMTTGALAAANNLEDHHSIFPGQELRVDGRPVAVADKTPKPESTEEVVAMAADETAAGQPESASETVADSVETDAVVPPEAVTATDEPSVLAERAIDESVVDIATTDEILATDAIELATATTAPDHSQLDSDPADYTVAADDTIEVQAAETLGHYADWLDIRANDLRRINNLAFGTPVVIGERITLDFARIDPAAFEQRRQGYHEEIQARFFRYYHITDTTTLEIRNGDSLWTLAQRSDNVPLWLLRQYNPELDFGRLRPGMEVRVPVVTRHPDADVPAEMVAETDDET